MRTPLLRTLLVTVGVLWLATDTASALTRRRRDNRDYGGRNRVIGDDDDDDRDRREEERKKKAEERREAREKAREEQERKEEEQRKAREAQRQERRKQAEQEAKEAAARRQEAAAERKADAKADEQAAEKLYSEAEAQLNEGNLLPGVKLLRQAAEEYPTTTAGDQAKQWLDYLTTQPEWGSRILFQEAEEAFDAQRYRQAQNRYLTLLEQYPQGEQAKAAKERLAEIETNDLLSKTKYTEEELEEARLWFLAGNIHLENGRRQEARAAYRTTIENYPGCRYAKQAEEKVAEMSERLARSGD
jgi:tetratricopeptide (TPR) repeat protein